MDYGRDVEFGYFPAPNADDHPAIVEQVHIADEMGLDLIGILNDPVPLARTADLRHGYLG